MGVGAQPGNTAPFLPPPLPGEELVAGTRSYVWGRGTHTATDTLIQSGAQVEKARWGWGGGGRTKSWGFLDPKPSLPPVLSPLNQSSGPL